MSYQKAPNPIPDPHGPEGTGDAVRQTFGCGSTLCASWEVNAFMQEGYFSGFVFERELDGPRHGQRCYAVRLSNPRRIVTMLRDERVGDPESAVCWALFAEARAG